MFLFNNGSQCLFPNFATPRKSCMIVCNEGKSSWSQMFYKVGVLKNFKTFTGKYLPCGLLFNKIVQNQPTEEFYNLLLKAKWNSCEICKILKTDLLKNICEQLVLVVSAEPATMLKLDTKNSVQSFYCIIAKESVDSGQFPNSIYFQ